MSGAKKMVPKRRFKEFLNAGDWEQRELAELCNVYDGTHQTPRYTNSGVMFVSVENIKTLESDKYISEDDFKNEFKIFPEFGDILLTRIGDVGSANIILDNIKRAYYVSLALLKPKGINSLFLLALLSSASVQSEIWKRTLHIAFPKKINKNEISKVIVSKPSILEQKKIGELIYALDQIITLHQRKLDKLQATKKALLQEMFPEEGQDKPKRRFKGFTDAWEQRKFLDLLDAQNGIRRGPFGSSLKKDSFVKKSDYVVYEQQNAIYDNYETRYFISKEKYNELIRFNIQPGDFIMSGAGTIGRISMVPDGIKKGVFNQALIRFKVNKDSINPLYFLKFMQSDMMQKQLTQANPGSAMTNLVPMDELKKWDVTIPSLEEQNRISTFINQIDAFITLHQRKLDKLKNLKQAYLNEMFV